MYKRELFSSIIDGLAHNAAVALLGPRQIGKTTLALEVAKTRPSIYLDLEFPDDVAKLKQPAAYFTMHENMLIILDEVQRIPGLFMILRSVIDQRRRKGQEYGQFLLLGSASHDLLQQSSESLAGRIMYLELYGLNPFEIQAKNQNNLQKLWFRGGFPKSYLAPSDKDSRNWRHNLIRTYLERDIPQLGPRIPAETLYRFWAMLAHSQGELFDASKLAASLGVKSPTTARYLDLMVDVLLLRRLQPWYTNTKKRLIKTPRVYIRDSGLLHQLLQIDDYEHLLIHPVLGKSWEGFVIEMILSILPDGVRPFFYRTVRGAEIDLLLEIKPYVFWAIEIKYTSKPFVKHGFHYACSDIKPVRKYVIYTGQETFPIADDIMAINLCALMEEIKHLHD